MAAARTSDAHKNIKPAALFFRQPFAGFHKMNGSLRQPHTEPGLNTETREPTGASGKQRTLRIQVNHVTVSGLLEGMIHQGRPEHHSRPACNLS